MIHLKTDREIEAMRIVCRLADRARRLAGEMVAPGVTTGEIDLEIRRLIEKDGAKPAFLGYRGYPNSACISINEELIHGIPGGRRILPGDIVSVDVGALLGGFYGDCAATFAAGEVTPEAKRLIEVTRQSFYEGLRFAERAIGSQISPPPSRRMWKGTAFPSSGTLWATGSAGRSTRVRRCPTTA